MNIIVCIKRVPATTTVIKVAGDGTSIDSSGVEYELNTYDEFAVEQALRTQEATGGETTVVTVGTADAVKELRDCLARGVDKAVLLKHDGDLDAHATATILASWLRDQNADVVFMGKQAVDGDNSQVPQRVATILDTGCVTEIKSLTLDGDTFTAERDIEGGRETVTCKTPCVLSTNKGLNDPRYANLKGIMKAKKKPLEEVDAATAKNALEIVSLTLPPERAEGRILGEGPDAVGALVEALKTEVKIL